MPRATIREESINSKNIVKQRSVARRFSHNEKIVAAKIGHANEKAENYLKKFDEDIHKA